MFKGKTILGLITARGGSKGLPGKNVRLLGGKPLIAWSIEQGLQSKYLDQVIVSTDSDEIAELAGKCGAEVPFMRPKALATDEAKSIDVIIHALDFYKEKGMEFDYLMLLEPTSPLREVEDIDRCIESLIGHADAESIVSVARIEGVHPDFTVIINRDGFIRKMDGSADFAIIRRQELTDLYFFEGTIYLSEVGVLFSKKSFYHDKTLAYVVPRWKSLEIDELQDLICAEALLNARNRGLF